MPFDQVSIEKVQINDTVWTDFVSSHPYATIFHHPLWSSVLSQTYGYQSFVLIMKNSQGKIIAGIPIMEISNCIIRKRWISLPFSDYCFVLYESQSASKLFASELLKMNKLKKFPPIELRSDLEKKFGAHRLSKYILYSLKLGLDPSVVFSQFSKKFRQYPRKAERNGLKSFSKKPNEDMDIFYSLHLKTRVKLGVPIQPKQFFILLLEQIINGGFGKIILVSDEDNQPISGAVMLFYKDKAMIKYSATDPKYLHTRAHYFTFWKCIEWACRNGMSEIDFGRTETNEGGLLKFKEGWGAKASALNYTILNEKPSKDSKGNSMIFVRKVIQNSPPWICRIIGELFYKYAA